jgi:hypothetical protein
MKILLADGANMMFKEPIKRQKELCEALANRPVSHDDSGVVIFPNDSDASWGYGLTLSKAEVDCL